MVSHNPFRIRASEYFSNENDFLDSFSIRALDVLGDNDIWNKLQIIQSARGGGKTSILRLFSPKSLTSIHKLKNTSEKLELIHQKLQQLGAMDISGPMVLAIPLSLASNYRILEALSYLERSSQDRLFFALLSARILIATLRSSLDFLGLEFPKDLEKISIHYPSEKNIPPSIPIPCSGSELFSWASSLEKKISGMIDNATKFNADEISGFDSLTALQIISAKNISYDSKPIAFRTLLMLDDVDKLTSNQIKNLALVLTDLRIPIGIWLAQRLEALHSEELLSPIATRGREYDEPITLERYWRKGDNYKKFERMVSEIADKRATLHKTYQVKDFEAMLATTLSSELNDICDNASKTIKSRLLEQFGKNKKYDIWLETQTKSVDVFQDPANMEILEILLHRDIRKKQTTLFEVTLSNEEFHTRLDSKTKHAAEYFIHNEFKIPYYYGFSKLSSLASSNVQQFLEFSSDLFDEMKSAQLLEQHPFVSGQRQEEILKKKASMKWDEIIHQIPQREHVREFLLSLKDFCKSETHLPNSPYAPGVTGFAISTSDRVKLCTESILERNKHFKILADVLAICISNNLLELFPHGKQGKKDSTTHQIMYLNRMLCLHFDLPIHYGGWREKSLDTLCDFYRGNFKPARRKQVDFTEQTTID